MSMLGLHQPGDSFLHRLSVGPKLAAVAVLSIAITVLRGPEYAVLLLAVAVALAVWAGIGVRTTWQALRGLVLVVALLGAYQWWQRGWPVAVEVAADLLSLVLAATVVTVTTPMDELLDTVVRGASRFRRLGVDPERVALAIALMIRAVPGLLEIARETRNAAKARGLERSPRALLVPMALRTVSTARATGDALAARGIGDDPPRG